MAKKSVQVSTKLTKHICRNTAVYTKAQLKVPTCTGYFFPVLVNLSCQHSSC